MDFLIERIEASVNLIELELLEWEVKESNDKKIIEAFHKRKFALTHPEKSSELQKIKEYWSKPWDVEEEHKQRSHGADIWWLIEFIEDLQKTEEENKQYRKEIVELRGKAHLSCPACHEDCIGWVVDGQPCRNDWKL